MVMKNFMAHLHAVWHTSSVSPDARKESPPPKFRAILPPELEGLEDEPFGPAMDVEEHLRTLEADLEAPDGE